MKGVSDAKMVPHPNRVSHALMRVRRLYDWSRAEDAPLMAVFDLFWNLAPNAKYWVKIARHKTFEECIDLLVKEPTF